MKLSAKKRAGFLVIVLSERQKKYLPRRIINGNWEVGICSHNYRRKLNCTNYNLDKPSLTCGYRFTLDRIAP